MMHSIYNRCAVTVVRRISASTLRKICTSQTRQLRVASQMPNVLNSRRSRNFAERFVRTPDGDAEWSAGDGDVEDAEDILSLTKEHKLAKLAEAKRLEKSSKSHLKSKIIERKYFRPLPSSNLLSWKAKEQIRYLYSCNPNEEGIESIVELFPITSKDAKLVIKNKKIMKSLAEIKKHDSGVYKKWRQLLDSTEPLDPGLQKALDTMLVSGQITNMENATGAADIPEIGTPTLQELAYRSTDAPGKLTNLLIKHGEFSLRSSPLPNKTLSARVQQSKKLHPKSTHIHRDCETTIDKDNENKVLLRKIIAKFNKNTTNTELSEDVTKDFNRHSACKSDGYLNMYNSRRLQGDVNRRESSKTPPAGREFKDEDGNVMFRVY